MCSAIPRSRASSSPVRPTCISSTASRASAPARRCCARSRSTSISPRRGQRRPRSKARASFSASTGASIRTSARCAQKIAAGVIGDLETLTLINHDPAAPPPAFIPRSGGLVQGLHHPRSRSGLLRCSANRRARSSPPPAAWSIRRSPSRAMSTRRAIVLRTKIEQALRHLQHAPQRLWLRSARGGLRLKRHGGDGQ